MRYTIILTVNNKKWIKEHFLALHTWSVDVYGVDKRQSIYTDGKHQKHLFRNKNKFCSIPFLFFLFFLLVVVNIHNSKLYEQ
jgi:hypothetical protein